MGTCTLRWQIPDISVKLSSLVCSTRPSDLESAFGRFGALKRCVIRRSIIAFVDYVALEDAVVAKRVMTGSEEFGKRLIVEFQASRHYHAGGGNGGGPHQS